MVDTVQATNLVNYWPMELMTFDKFAVCVNWTARERGVRPIVEWVVS